MSDSCELDLDDAEEVHEDGGGWTVVTSQSQGPQQHLVTANRMPNTNTYQQYLTCTRSMKVKTIQRVIQTML